MVSDALINAGEFDKIKELTKQAVNTMLGFELRHVGINSSNEKEAEQTAETFEKIFGFVKNSGNMSVFAGTEIEVMKTPYRGTHGHIAITTNYLERAVYHMTLQGVEFDMDSAKYKDEKMTLIYLKDEVGGFALHLVQR